MKIWKHRAAVAAEAAVQVDPPTEYYTSRYSGEEIDKGIDGALQLGGASTPQGAIAALGAGVRPNLLVNPFFKINQRNQKRYTGIVPTVDAWFSNSTSLTVQVTDNGVTLTGTGYDYLKQYLENPGQYNGKTMTISAIVKNPGGQFRINLYNESKQISMAVNIAASSNWSIISTTIQGLQVSDGDRLAFLLYPGGGISGQTATAQVMAVKMEEGENQTLGYIDSSGNPVLLERPDPLEELKCKRLQLILPQGNSLNYAPIGYGYILGASARILVPTPIKMRTNPTLGFINGSISGLTILTTTDNAIPTAVSNINALEYGVSINFAIPSGAENETPCTLRCTTGYAFLNANIV